MTDAADDLRTSASLLGKLGDLRDEEAWRRFLEQYRPLIASWCARRGLAGQEAEEVTATVLLKLARAMPTYSYDRERGSFRGWLKTVVDNTVKDLRRTWSRRPGDRGSGDSQVHELLHQVEAPDGLDELVDTLDARLERDRRLARLAQERVRQRVESHTWEAFWLTAIEGRPGAEVAAELGIKVTAVHMAKCRVAKMLREEAARLEKDGA